MKIENEITGASETHPGDARGVWGVGSGPLESGGLGCVLYPIACLPDNINSITEGSQDKNSKSRASLAVDRKCLCNGRD
jgi:hypothetical protein